MENSAKNKPQGRAWRSCAAALLLGTVLIAATAIVHLHSPSSPSGEPTSTTGATRNLRTAFIWISISFLLLAWIVLWLLHSSSRIRAWIVKWKRADAPVDAFFYASLSAIALGIGVFGLWTCSGKSLQPSPHSSILDVPKTHQEPLWSKVTAAATAAAWLLVAAVLLGMSIVAAVRAIPPGQETPPVFMLLRCSCCSLAFRRVIVALPFISLSIVSGTLWHHASTTHTICAAAREPLHLLLGSTIVFSSIVGALATVTFAPLFFRRYSSGTSHTWRRVYRAVIFCFLIIFGASAIVWAVKSWRWLRSYEKTLADNGSCAVDAGSISAVRFTTGALFTSGVLLLVMTTCCRLERHLVPPAATPQIDLSMLSPHAIRAQALTDDAA